MPPAKQATRSQAIEDPSYQTPIMNNAAAEHSSAIQMNHAASTPSSRIAVPEMPLTKQVENSQPVDGASSQTPVFDNAPVENSSTNQAPFEYVALEDRPYTGPPIVFKMQFFKMFQIRIHRWPPIGRQLLTWKTAHDQYPWSTTLVVPVRTYDIVLFRRVSDIAHFLNLVDPDSGRPFSISPTLIPPSPSEILPVWDACQASIESGLRYPPGLCDRDSSLKALYRIYFTILLDYNLGMRNELEYFCHRSSWRVHKIPDPMDPDPARYAMLAATTQLLVLAFNARIEIGLHRDREPINTWEEHVKDRARKKRFEFVPEWATRVPPLENTLWLPEVDGDGVQDPEHPSTCAAFKKKNILLITPHIHFT